MLSNGSKEYHRRPRESKHRGEYSVALVTIGLVIVISFIAYRVYISYTGNLQESQEIEFVSYYEPRESFNIRSQADYYKQFLESLVEQPSCPLFKEGNTLLHSNHALFISGKPSYQFVEEFVLDKISPVRNNSNKDIPIGDYYNLIDGITEQPLALIAPWPFAYESNNIENPNLVSISSKDPIGKNHEKFRIDFKNAYWPCVGANPTKADLEEHIVHYDRVGNGNLSRIQSGAGGDIIGYATEETTISFYKWDSTENEWKQCKSDEVMNY